jgi:hypothetical protein
MTRKFVVTMFLCVAIEEELLEYEKYKNLEWTHLISHY